MSGQFINIVIVTEGKQKKLRMNQRWTIQQLKDAVNSEIIPNMKLQSSDFDLHYCGKVLGEHYSNVHDYLIEENEEVLVIVKQRGGLTW